MRKILTLFVLLCGCHTWAQLSTPPAPGCRFLTAPDADNDGFATFDIDQYFTQFRADALALNYDLSGYTFELYPSEADYTAGTNVIVSPYNNIVAFEQFCYMKFIYSGTGPFYDAAELTLPFGCHKLETTAVLSSAQNSQERISFYPNPASDIVRFNPVVSDLKLSTCDGKALKIIFQNQILEVADLPKGIYLVTGTTQNGNSFTEKLIKE